MGLTGKQTSFVHHYLGQCRFNATAAAKAAGYRATSQHSFEAIGAENLLKPEIRRILDEHWKLSRMSAQECLGELTKLARGSSKDKLRALALLSQHHGLLDGGGATEEIEERAKQIADQKIEAWYNEVNRDVEEYNRKAEANNRDKDKQFHLIVKRYQHNEEAVAALQLMFRVMKGYERVEKEPEPAPQPTEIEIIPPSRRLQPAAVERMLAEVIVEEEIPEEPRRRGLVYVSENTSRGFPIPCGHGYHGPCSLCMARIP